MVSKVNDGKMIIFYHLAKKGVSSLSLIRLLQTISLFWKIIVANYQISIRERNYLFDKYINGLAGNDETEKVLVLVTVLIGQKTKSYIMQIHKCDHTFRSIIFLKSLI